MNQNLGKLQVDDRSFRAGYLAPHLHHQDCRRIHIDNWRIHTVQQDMGFDKGFDFYPPLTDSDVDKVSTALPDNVVKEYLVLTTSLKYRPCGRPFLMKSEKNTKSMTTWQLNGMQSFLSKASILASSWMGTVSADSVQRLVEAIRVMSRRTSTSTKLKSLRNGISDGGFIPGLRSWNRGFGFFFSHGYLIQDSCVSRYHSQYL